MSDSTQMEVPPRTLDEAGNKTFSLLLRCYLQQNPGKSQESFRDDLWNPLFADKNTSGDKMLAQISALQETNPSIPYGTVAPIVISIAYCAQARQEINAKKRDDAWFAMTEARFWCGVAAAEQGIKIVREQTILATRRSTAAKGGNSRAANQKSVKDEAFRLARELRPTEGWSSRAQAVRTIQDAVLKLAKEKNRPLSVTQAPTTIGRWLSTMTDASTLFPSQKTKAPGFIK